MRWLALILLLTLAACNDRTAAPILPDALGVGPNRTVFLGTTRLLNEGGEYGIGRAHTLSFLRANVSIPPRRAVGTVSYGFEAPDPEKNFALAGLDRYDTADSFTRSLREEIAVSRSERREVTVFVHGFNNSFTDAAFRMAQLAHDLEIPGAQVSYSWPSRGNPLGYEYDRDSALFARDGLAELLRAVKAAGNPDLILVAHSMGSKLVMETLRQLEIAEPGWSGRNLRAVILLSPDINIDVFRSQFKRLETVPDPFVVIVSRKDRFLRLSSRLRGEKTQLGNIDNADAVGDLPITVVDVSEFSDGKGNHFVAGGSPALIQILRRSGDLNREFLRGRRGSTVVVPGQQRIVAPAPRSDTALPADNPE